MIPVPEPLQPGATIGLLGGGQLAQMLVLAGHAMGFRFMVFDPDPNCSAALAGAKQITASYTDSEALAKLADSCQVVTYEFENVDAEAVSWLEERVDLPQGSEILRIAQNRLTEKKSLAQLKIPIPPYQKITTEYELVHAMETFGELKLKTVTGGYDGKGQVRVSDTEQIPDAFNTLSQAKTEIVAEQFVLFEKEISVIVARNRLGEVRCFPVAENVHEKNILTVSRIPARLVSKVSEQAQLIAKKIAVGLELVGVLGVEMFVLPGGKLLVNELAPRPHNSGHFTQNACATSQFEQHLRAITNLPLGSTELHKPAVMLNILGEHLPMLLKKLKDLPPEAKLHLYGKQECRYGRKMGHLNLTSDPLESLLDPLLKLGIWNEALLSRML
jgi:5-(carboxyamino)imidazole ribonucleotide synthase